MEAENSVEEPVNTPESREARKKQEKDRKKGGKKAESFLKSIAHLPAEEKVEILSKKNTEALEEIRNYKVSVQILQRRIQVVEKEKEQLQNEQSKGLLARSRLETLCRELQRQNKSIKDESLQKIREEEEKRKEVSHRFQTALNEVSTMMQQNTDKNLKLRDDNIEISNKFQKLCEEFKSREEEVIRLTRQLDLEKQLAEATLKRTECQLNAEREIWNKEKEHFLAQQNLNAEEKRSLEANIRGLEEHLAMYSTKYDEFENTISKSNQVFDSYKVEMHRMSKHMSKFEQECNIWKERWLQSQQTINRITSENRSLETNVQERDKKIKNLSDLCRSIQDERSAYIKQLKEEGLTPVVVVHEPKPKPEPVKVETAKQQNTKHNNSHPKTKKEKELALLKKEMQAIESQLADTLKTSLQKETKSGEKNEEKTLVEDINKSMEELSETLKKDITLEIIDSNIKTEVVTKEPEKPEESKKPEEPEKSEEPKKLQEPVKSEETKTPEEPAKPEEPKKLQEPAKPDEPKKPEEPAKPEEPKKPQEPAKPEEPKKPQEPAKPEEPKKLQEPAKPEELKKPEEPKKHQEPAKPEEPKKPQEPGKPEELKKSQEPAKPEELKKPEEPAKPKEPTKPTKPAKPESPKKPNEENKTKKEPKSPKKKDKEPKTN